MKIYSILIALVFWVASVDMSVSQLLLPEDYVSSLPKPHFSPGHTLPLLTWDGYGNQSSNLTVELGKNWGYAMDLNDCYPRMVTNLMVTPGQREYGLAQLSKSDPTHFKLTTHTFRAFENYDFLSKSFWTTNASGDYVDGQGNTSSYFKYIVTGGVTNNFYPAVSSEAPDADWQSITDYQMLLLKQCNSNAPLSVIANDGEFGMSEYSSNWRGWWQDPRFIAKMNALGLTNSPIVYNADPQIFTYLSQRKSHELAFLANAIKTNFPSLELYYYYHTGMEKFRIVGNGYPTNSTPDGMNSGDGWDSTYMVTNFAYPSAENYYRSFNTGYTNSYPGGSFDVSSYGSQILQFVNWVGWNITKGRSLNYSWLNGGWGRSYYTNAGIDSFSDIPRYMGFLKCCYTMGMLGGNAGYYEDLGVHFNDPFYATNAPQWLTQEIALSHVHAQFSWLENYIRNGDLLPGPYAHIMSADQPAYDFATGGGGTNDVHVYARKLRASNNWLITAWAANGPTNVNVTVNIPTLGNVTVLARDSGSVYTGTAANNLTLFDANGTYPTEQFSNPTTIQNVSIGGKPILRVIGGQP